MFQLPPVKAPNIFSAYISVFGSTFYLWNFFKMCELTEVRRQQGEPLFTDIFNAPRIGELPDENVEVLNNRKYDI